MHNCVLEQLNFSFESLSTDLDRLTRHHNGRWNVENMNIIRRHSLELYHQADADDIDTALYFFRFCKNQLSVLVQELSNEEFSEWARSPDTKISTRQLFKLIDRFVQDTNDEIRRIRLNQKFTNQLAPFDTNWLAPL